MLLSPPAATRSCTHVLPNALWHSQRHLSLLHKKESLNSSVSSGSRAPSREGRASETEKHSCNRMLRTGRPGEAMSMRESGSARIWLNAFKSNIGGCAKVLRKSCIKESCAFSSSADQQSEGFFGQLPVPLPQLLSQMPEMESLEYVLHRERERERILRLECPEVQ